MDGAKTNASAFTPIVPSLTSVLDGLGLTKENLSGVEDPKGRVDVLASRLLEMGASRVSPGVAGILREVKPFTDGFFSKHLRGVKLPFVPSAEPVKRTRKRK